MNDPISSTRLKSYSLRMWSSQPHLSWTILKPQTADHLFGKTQQRCIILRKYSMKEWIQSYKYCPAILATTNMRAFSIKLC